MNLNSLMWVSVKRFRQLMGWPADAIYEACKLGGIDSKFILGEHQICITNLSPRALEQHLSDEIKNDEQQNADLIEDQKIKNSPEYANLKYFQKKNVDKWLLLFRECCYMKGEELEKYLDKKNKVASYPTYCRHKKLWDESGHNINVLKPGWGNRLKEKSSKKPL